MRFDGHIERAENHDIISGQHNGGTKAGDCYMEELLNARYQLKLMNYDMAGNNGYKLLARKIKDGVSIRCTNQLINKTNQQPTYEDDSYIELNCQLKTSYHIVTITKIWYHPLQAFPKLHLDVKPKKFAKPVIQTRTLPISHLPSRPSHSWSSNSSYAPNNSSNNLR